jgi:glutathione S-transferase
MRALALEEHFVTPAFLDGKTFIGGDHPSIADIRLTCSLEFLNVINSAFPDWAKTYMAAVETTLRDAYAEPGGDRGLHRLGEGAEEVGDGQAATMDSEPSSPPVR